MSGSVPRHSSENLGHGTDVGEARECKAQADECGEEEPAGTDGECQRDAAEHEQARAEANLSFEGPARPDVSNDGEPGLHPGARAAFQYRELKLAWLEKASGHAGALAHLADEDDRCGRAEVGEPGLDLVHRDVDCPGDVAGRELGRGAYVDQLRLARRLRLERGNCDGWRQNFLLLGKSGREVKRIQGALPAIEFGRVDVLPVLLSTASALDQS